MQLASNPNQFYKVLSYELDVIKYVEIEPVLGINSNIVLSNPLILSVPPIT